MTEPHGADAPRKLELPTAGRKPPPAADPAAAQPRETPAPTGDATGTPAATVPPPDGDEVTRLLPVPAAPAARDEPGVDEPTAILTPETPAADVPVDPDGPTRPLWPREAVTQRLETPRDAEAAPNAGERGNAGEAGTAANAGEPEIAANAGEPGTAANAGEAGTAGEAETAAGASEARAAVDEAEPRGAGEPRAADPPASPDPVTAADDPAPGAESGGVPEEAQAAAAPAPAPRRRLSSAGVLIWVLLALFGFTLVVQLRSNDGDQGLATARQEDLVRILSDLEARDSRLQSEIAALETSQRQLTSGVAGRQAALAEAEKRADELELLAGTVPGRGPGLIIVIDKVKASAVLNAVQELRGAGGEVMQVAGAAGNTVRIVASTYFVDAEGGGIIVDGARLTGPYTLSVIGSPQTMQTALQIPGGVVASVNSADGSVRMEQHNTVEVTAVRNAATLQYARPVS